MITLSGRRFKNHLSIVKQNFNNIFLFSHYQLNLCLKWWMYNTITTRLSSASFGCKKANVNSIRTAPMLMEKRSWEDLMMTYQRTPLFRPTMVLKMTLSDYLKAKTCLWITMITDLLRRRDQTKLTWPNLVLGHLTSNLLSITMMNRLAARSLKQTSWSKMGSKTKDMK